MEEESEESEEMELITFDMVYEAMRAPQKEEASADDAKPEIRRRAS